MEIINKITSVGPTNGVALSVEDIQAHLDEQNADGYYLIAVDNLVGGYRFFWAKEVV